MTYITKSQLEELLDSFTYGYGMKEYHEKLREYTGIDARPYTAYQYFDIANVFIGDSNNSLEELLESAYIKVIDDV